MNKFKETYTTALTVIIPEEHVAKINKIRRVHDKAYPRWMPHINLIYPFIGSEHFDDIEDKLVQAFIDNPITPFTVKLNQLEYFNRGKDITFHLKPEDTTKLCKVFDTIVGSLTGVKLKRQKLVPHMTLGQCSIQDFRAMKSDLAKQLDLKNLEFVVENICLIKRDQNDNTVPFSLVKTIPIGGEDTGMPGMW